MGDNPLNFLCHLYKNTQINKQKIPWITLKRSSKCNTFVCEKFFQMEKRKKSASYPVSTREICLSYMYPFLSTFTLLANSQQTITTPKRCLSCMHPFYPPVSKQSTDYHHAQKMSVVHAPLLSPVSKQSADYHHAQKMSVVHTPIFSPNSPSVSIMEI
jgi:hypothetical protein